MTIANWDMQTKLSFGLPDRLAKALDVADITSIDMADYLGVSRTTISNYTHGRSPVKKQTLRLWALRTGVPLQWLETGLLNAPVGLGGLEPPASTVEYGRLATVTAIRKVA